MKLRLVLSLLILAISFGSYAQDATGEEGKAKKEKKEKPEKEPKEKKEKKPSPPYYDNKLPYIYVGGGNLSLLNDDLNDGANLYNVASWKWGINAGIEHRTFSAVGFSLNFLYGWVGSSERSPIPSTSDNMNLGNRNIETEIMNLDFKVNVYLDNNLFINRASRWSPYLFGGVGYMLQMKQRTDLMDGDNNQYYYWDDGTVRDRPKTQENLGTANVLDIDRDPLRPVAGGDG